MSGACLQRDAKEWLGRTRDSRRVCLKGEVAVAGLMKEPQGNKGRSWDGSKLGFWWFCCRGEVNAAHVLLSPVSGAHVGGLRCIHKVVQSLPPPMSQPKLTPPLLQNSPLSFCSPHTLILPIVTLCPAYSTEHDDSRFTHLSPVGTWVAPPSGSAQRCCQACTEISQRPCFWVFRVLTQKQNCWIVLFGF